MKKLIAIVVLLMAAMFMVPCTGKAANGSDPEFALSTVRGAVGDQVNVSLDVRNNPGITALQLQIGYSEKDLELVSVEDQKLFGDAISCGQQGANPFIISWFSSASKDIYENGTLAVMVFRIKDGAESSEVTLRYDQENVFNISLESVPFQTVDGKVAVGTNENDEDNEERSINGGIYRKISTDKVEYVRPSNKKNKKVEIPSKVQWNGTWCNVSMIAGHAFYGNNKLESVVIGKNIEEIGWEAFYNCRKLKEITIPAKVKKIGEKAFTNCKKLSKITIKSTKLKADTVGKQAFQGGYARPVVKVPKNYKNTYKKILQAKGMSKRAIYK